MKFSELHKVSGSFAAYQAGIRACSAGFRLIFVQTAVSGDF